jgi:hypothetical protein
MAKKNDNNLQNEIRRVIAAARPEPLTLNGRAPVHECHTANIVQLVGWGQTHLAADHLLFPEINGSLLSTVSGVARQLGIKFYRAKPSLSVPAEERAARIRTRFFAYDFLLETFLNFLGLESRWLDEPEKDAAAEFLIETLNAWENWEIDECDTAPVAAATVENLLAGMDRVQGGASMIAKSAGRIRAAMRGRTPTTIEFLLAAQEEIQTNIYYKLVEDGQCKFGNDYALGLRWLRHLGFEQVSTNPVLAAKAYEDEPGLSEAFRAEVVRHPRFDTWRLAPEKSGDEITLYATLLALWDNLHVYRPIFYNLADTTGGGVVSFQLNPNLAHLAGESVEDALTALEYAQDELRVYDSYLLAGYCVERELARPNMVIKVAASHPAARTIARTINEHGLGSNITVVYTVAQQATMILEEMAGMAAAIKKGILPTQMYMTNMGGRFESHLREDALLRYFIGLKNKIGEKKTVLRLQSLAKALGAEAKVNAAATFEEKVFQATAYNSGLREINEHLIKALSGVADKKELEQLEADLQKSGTLVARRVWHIFFSDKNREKWIRYLCDAYDLIDFQARFIMNRINYLPASKRRPMDTYWTLTANNMVHTEFGNHQENVLQTARQKDFDLADYVESIRDDFGPEVVERLSRLPDFLVGYETNAELNQILKQAGIKGDFGARGHKPAQWGAFGSVRKTSGEFMNAYNKFKENMLGLLPKE